MPITATPIKIHATKFVLFKKMVLLSSHTFPGKKAPHRTAVMVVARIKRRGVYRSSNVIGTSSSTMFTSVVEHMTALTKCLQISGAIVGRIIINVRRRQDHFCCSN